ncbi:unnamed protein product [Didymodactylos carnosus]|uniref:U3 small nucleolar RNA-associated protein 15 homolog n=1 Tax=Didymodactylos carnosus TaxID=1234261 RepID=A0A814AV49_9BILA|nr:unnamed protein product [Didymodactylos carnosus]CAF0918994.1 unnamed protein product [Didymodactylos carnosus]CAF3672632.1 unnamed protein product [Didymodactylos carnosus]CAF3698678.1 unnamed protein product [Didymodactylos carnosus]
MSDFKQLHIERSIDDRSILSDDNLYWQGLNEGHPVTFREYGPVTKIDVAPIKEQWVSITDSTRVQIYSPESLTLVRSFYSFKETVYCGTFRSDGRLLCAGAKDGLVRVFDFETRSQLRLFKEHQGSPVHCTYFSRDKNFIITGSDDRTVRIFDLATEKEFSTFSNIHTDYVRALAPGQMNSNLLLSGSYDHTMKLLDKRTGTSVLSVDHGHQIESVLVYSNETLAITAGGPCVKVWDLLGGGRLLANLSNHHKSILCTAFSSDQHYILSGGLDRHIKVYDATTFRVVHTLQYPDAVLSMAILNPDDKALLVGMPGGLWSMRRRTGQLDNNNGYIINNATTTTNITISNEDNDRKMQTTDDTKSITSSSESRRRRKRRFFPSGIATPVLDSSDHLVSANRRPHLEAYDNYLRKFRASSALDAAFTASLKHRQPELAIIVLKELFRRNMIKQALAGRDDTSLLKIVRFIQKHFSKANAMPTLIDVTYLLSQIYIKELMRKGKNTKAIMKLKDLISQELRYQSELMRTKGAIETILLGMDTQGTTTMNAA